MRVQYDPFICMSFMRIFNWGERINIRLLSVCTGSKYAKSYNIFKSTECHARSFMLMFCLPSPLVWGPIFSLSRTLDLSRWSSPSDNCICQINLLAIMKLNIPIKSVLECLAFKATNKVKKGFIWIFDGKISTRKVCQYRCRSPGDDGVSLERIGRITQIKWRRCFGLFTFYTEHIVWCKLNRSW